MRKFTNEKTLIRLLESCEKYKPCGVPASKWKSIWEVGVKNGLVMWKINLTDYVKRFLIKDDGIKVFNIIENVDRYWELNGLNIYTG